MPRHRVTTKGSNVPEHIDSFDALKDRYHLSSHLLANLAQSGYKRPTGIQSYGIPILMEVNDSITSCHAFLHCQSQSRDLAAISPTGTGKTLSYLLPMISSLGAPSSSTKVDTGTGVRALVLAPTRELAHQIHNECLKLTQGRKWKIVLFSKATASTLADRNARDKVGKSAPQRTPAVDVSYGHELLDIIISTPLRLVSALQAGHLELDKWAHSPFGIYTSVVHPLFSVRHMILDEADRMLDTEFLSQVQEVIAACTYPNLQKAVFSATLPAGAEKIAMSMLRDPIRVVVGLKCVFQSSFQSQSHEHKHICLCSSGIRLSPSSLRPLPMLRTTPRNSPRYCSTSRNLTIHRY